MEKELKSFSDGEYIFAETENDNQFYFYRVDGKKLGNVENIPMDMYQNYICMKMFKENLKDIILNNLQFDKSIDGKCIRITTFTIGEKELLEKTKDNGIKKLVKTLFGKSKKN